MIVASLLRALRSAFHAAAWAASLAQAVSVTAVAGWTLALLPAAAHTTDGTPHLCGTGRAPSDEYG